VGATLLVTAPLWDYQIDGLSPTAPAPTCWVQQTTALKILLLGQASVLLWFCTKTGHSQPN